MEGFILDFKYQSKNKNIVFANLFKTKAINKDKARDLEKLAIEQSIYKVF